MKSILTSVAFIFCHMGSVGCYAMREVDFVYVNLSENEIIVDSIDGLPPWVTPGVLVSSHAEDRLSEKSMTMLGGPVEISPVLKIVWREGEALHHAKLTRDDLGMPAKIRTGKIRFTYLGGDKWRVTIFK